MTTKLVSPTTGQSTHTRTPGRCGTGASKDKKKERARARVFARSGSCHNVAHIRIVTPSPPKHPTPPLDYPHATMANARARARTEQKNTSETSLASQRAHTYSRSTACVRWSRKHIMYEPRKTSERANTYTAHKKSKSADSFNSHGGVGRSKRGFYVRYMNYK